MNGQLLLREQPALPKYFKYSRPIIVVAATDSP